MGTLQPVCLNLVDRVSLCLVQSLLVASLILVNFCPRCLDKEVLRSNDLQMALREIRSVTCEG
jgi:hypothetical protein